MSSLPTSEVISTRDNFLHGRPQQNGVLVLAHIAALDVAQRRVRLRATGRRFVTNGVDDQRVRKGPTCMMPTSQRFFKPPRYFSWRPFAPLTVAEPPSDETSQRRVIAPATHGMAQARRRTFALQPSSAKRQRAESLVNVSEQLLGARHSAEAGAFCLKKAHGRARRKRRLNIPEGHVGRMEILHIVAAFQVLNDVATTRRAKRFNRIELAFLHTRRVPTFGAHA